MSTRVCSAGPETVAGHLQCGGIRQVMGSQRRRRPRSQEAAVSAGKAGSERKWWCCVVRAEMNASPGARRPAEDRTCLEPVGGVGCRRTGLLLSRGGARGLSANHQGH